MRLSIKVYHSSSQHIATDYPRHRPTRLIRQVRVQPSPVYHILANIIADVTPSMGRQNRVMFQTNGQSPGVWKLYVDDSSNTRRSSIVLVLTLPQVDIMSMQSDVDSRL